MIVLPSIQFDIYTVLKRNIVLQERISNEWGLQSSATKELMLKRARKMKGKKKKTEKADDKLRKFHQIAQQSSTVPVVQKPPVPTNKIDYFKGELYCNLIVEMLI